ncbi:MAG: TrkA family potassium uptake protein [Planctomycetes bacterium]|nr:TrkA family potassium uptake protein [Planctomycetota bacterium]MBU1517733.1 TrkA family potassium uptake protein [Planctomycetota bacterium]MBU2457851.1 TrkA family potassium uptake protein [Planctomycetota bacterium]MBU2597297.1 TrkA family potassium uptake protein [Planctomycetota bacterium]
MKKFAVIGLGRFGQKLATALTMSEAEVIAIDQNREIIDQIRDEVTHAVRIDSTDEEALRAQGVDKVDVAIVGIGQGGRSFESSILTVVNLKSLGVPLVYARAESITQGQVLAKIGATEVIYPEIESAQKWAYRLIAPQITEKIDFAPGYSIASIIAPASFHEKTVLDLQLRQKYRINLVSIKRGEKTGSEKEKGEIINVPLPDTVIYQGDTMVVAGSDLDLAKLPGE